MAATPAPEETEPEVNLAALGIARIALSDPACARYALHLVEPDGLLKGPHDDLVRVAFTQPVKISAVRVRVRGGPARQLSFDADVLGPDGTLWSSSGAVGEGVMTLRPATPIPDATAVVVRMSGGHLKPVQLEVLGNIAGAAADGGPSGARSAATALLDGGTLDTAANGPLVDEPGCAELAENVSIGRKEQLDADMDEVKAHATRIRTLDAALQSETDPHARAWTWLELNHEADGVAALTNPILRRVEWETGLEAVNLVLAAVEEMAGGASVNVHYCEQDGEMAAAAGGYRMYLELWPNGPDADEAAFWAIEGNGPRCAHLQGDEETYARLRKAYQDFVEQFPKSARASDARKVLAQLDDEEKALNEKPQEAEDGGSVSRAMVIPVPDDGQDDAPPVPKPARRKKGQGAADGGSASNASDGTPGASGALDVAPPRLGAEIPDGGAGAASSPAAVAAPQP
jgi:hypothetical protein